VAKEKERLAAFLATLEQLKSQFDKLKPEFSQGCRLPCIRAALFRSKSFRIFYAGQGLSLLGTGCRR